MKCVSHSRRTVLADERGAMTLLLAIFATLILILSIGFIIDLPTVRTAAVKAQFAADRATEAGAELLFIGHQRASEEAHNAAITYLEDTAAGSLRSFAQTLVSGGSCALTIPRIGETLYGYPGCAIEVPIKLRSIFEQSWSGIPVDDYGNGISFYARFTPHRYLPLLSESEIEVMSVRRLQTIMSYVLFTPAFSLNDPPPTGGGRGNYDYIFGEDFTSDTPSPRQWPVYNALDDSRTLDNWSYPVWTGEFGRHPVTAQEFFPPHNLPISSAGDTANRRISRFYSALCDSAPWAYYKKSAVDLLDRMTTSSAFNETTLVGLTGYGQPLDLIPIHPNIDSNQVPATSASGQVVLHWDENASPPQRVFPVHDSQLGNPAYNLGLHMPKQTAFTGFVNTGSSRFNANYGADALPFYSGSDGDDNIGSGINDWTLCLCSELYKVSSSYALQDDWSFAGDGEDSMLLHHAETGRRQRVSGDSHWCDATHIAGSPGNLVVDLPDRRSAQPWGTAQGETARNLIANLAMRVPNAFLERVEATGPMSGSQFVPPGPPADIAAANPLTDVFTGRYVLSDGIRRASQLLRDAHDQYSWQTPTNAWARLRPLGNRPMLMAISPSVVDGFTATQLDLAGSDSTADFEGALGTALCQDNVAVFLAFLPMDEFDRTMVAQVQDTVRKYREVYEWIQAGNDPRTNPGGAPHFLRACAPVPQNMAPVKFYAVDYQSFVNLAASVDDRQGRFAAARFFSTMVLRAATKELVRFDYAG